jgi:hypothetical protein
MNNSESMTIDKNAMMAVPDISDRNEDNLRYSSSFEFKDGKNNDQKSLHNRVKSGDTEN